MSRFCRAALALPALSAILSALTAAPQRATAMAWPLPRLPPMPSPLPIHLPAVTPGMPGWQIALIAGGAAALAAVTAITLDRARMARRKPSPHQQATPPPHLKTRHPSPRRR